ncbi:MAG: MbnP family protein, partial [Verrucomicrobiota bacterium]
MGPVPVEGNELLVNVVPYIDGQPCRDGSLLREQGRLKVSRADFLISGLQLKKKEGAWIEEARGWEGFFSLDGRQVGAHAKGLPPGDYSAVRFRVGLPAKVNDSDPNQYPPDHPLHPDLNGLHWGWEGGYIFLALEGHWQNAKGKTDGFSYHLANDPEAMQVELPVAIRGTTRGTLRLALHLDKVLHGIDPDKDGSSTHSRNNDPLAARIRKNVRQAFTVLSYEEDLLQRPSRKAEEKGAPIPAGTTPYHLPVTTRFPQLELPADNPLTKEGVELGRRLFHDTRLSSTNRLSCASCHDQKKAFSDSRKLSAGAAGTSGKRHAMPLFNLAWAPSFFWDGRSTRLRDQVLEPIEAPHELNESLEKVVEKLRLDSAYPTHFSKAFGSPGISSERIALALEQFLMTLVSQNSRFDRAARGLATLTEEEKRGLQLFVTEFDPARGLHGADCFHCHSGNLFTNHRFTNNGLDSIFPDDGRMEVSQDPVDRGKFKTPSLRNVALTAPYMHDGRFATLEEVIDHYNNTFAVNP